MGGGGKLSFFAIRNQNHTYKSLQDTLEMPIYKAKPKNK